MLPVNKQVEFWITTDNVPMSAFFIPQLGSQIYTMTGMRTRLHLVPTQVGTYDGMNTQYNGAGFSDMHFVVQVVTDDELKKWMATVKRSPERLTTDTYQSLLRPVINAKPVFYSFVEDNLFNQVIETYMHSIGTIHPRADLSGFQY
jgi:cytochrome o ubiquinol oxidase subunit 2